jgi:hypothetical protein
VYLYMSLNIFVYLKNNCSFLTTLFKTCSIRSGQDEVEGILKFCVQYNFMKNILNLYIKHSTLMKKKNLQLQQSLRL